MNPDPELSARATIGRREAIRRATVMLGVAISPGLLDSVLRAQATSPAAGRKPYLNARQSATVAAVAERILPRTDTPGAADVGVPAFIDLMYGEYLTAEEQRMFAGGLADVEAQSTSTHRRNFAQLTTEQQDALLRGIARASQAKERTFFHQVRELTILGYFTSEEVGKNVLQYDPIPGRWDACIPLAEVGNRAWTR